jgi:hypothetical protein
MIARNAIKHFGHDWLKACWSAEGAIF